MLKHLTGREVQVEDVMTSSGEEDKVYYFVLFDHSTPKDLAELFEILEVLDSHKYFPIEGYEQVSALGYTVSVHHVDDPNPFSSIINENAQEFSYINIEVMRSILENEIMKRAKLEDEVKSIKEFLNQSGLLYYKSLNEHIIDKLDEKNILRKDDLKSEIFTTIH